MFVYLEAEECERGEMDARYIRMTRHMSCGRKNRSLQQILGF